MTLRISTGQINDSDRRSILQNQNGGHNQDQDRQQSNLHIAFAWQIGLAFFLRTLTSICADKYLRSELLPSNVNTVNSSRIMFLNINVFFCFAATTALICVITSVLHCNIKEQPNAMSSSDLTPAQTIQHQCIIVTSAPQIQRQ